MYRTHYIKNEWMISWSSDYQKSVRLLLLTPVKSSKIKDTSIRAGFLLEECRTLLYDVYVKEQGWRPTKNNPMKIQECISILLPRKKILKDCADDHATWVVITDITYHVIACGRVQISNSLWPLEMTRYLSCPPELRMLLTDIEVSTIEINRFAISQGWRNVGFSILMAHILIDYGRSQGATKMVFSTTIDSIARLALLPGIRVLETYKFQYEDHDPLPAKVFLVDISDDMSGEAVYQTGIRIHLQSHKNKAKL